MKWFFGRYTWFGFVFPADHGIFAHGLQQCFIFLYELALPQSNAVVLFQLFAQMLIHPPLQLFLNGHTQLLDIPVGLPTDGSKPCGAVLLDEQVIQHLLLFITEGEEELEEKTVCCQLVQLVGTGEDDVEKISLTELSEPWQIHPQRGRSSDQVLPETPTAHCPQVFVVTLPVLPLPQSFYEIHRICRSKEISLKNAAKLCEMTAATAITGCRNSSASFSNTALLLISKFSPYLLQNGKKRGII